MKRILPLLLLLTASCAAAPAQTQVADRIDWPAFMARHDLVWTQIPTRWEDSPFVGDGQIGATLYTESNGDLAWHMGRRDVVYHGDRIAIGDLVLKTVGKPVSLSMRQELLTAQIVGDLTTTAGEIKFRTFTHATRWLQVIEIHPSTGESACQFQWLPGNPNLLTPRQSVPDNEQNPRVQLSPGQAIQDFQTGGGHATIWTEVAANGGRVVYLSIGFSPDTHSALQEATATVQSAVATGFDQLLSTHQDWWRNFYAASFLSIPDTRLESFYWIQIYKLGSGTRADVPVMDTMGPWYRFGNFPRIWWNLNVQLQYWACLGSNHLDLALSMSNTLDKHLKQLSANAKQFGSDSYALGRSGSYDLNRSVGEELCDLPWACHNYWLQYRYSMDDTMLRQRIYPLLKGSINYYLHLLAKGPDGKLHIPHGFSPEYPDQPTPDPDCNIDLGLLRWGCQTLLDICDHFSIDDPQIPQWKSILVNLTPYPVDENGLMISATIPYAISHRHYSHMLMMYPLYLMNWENPDDRPLMELSFNHWTSLTKAWAGFSYTGAASISASMRKGDDAIEYLHGLMDFKGIHPNTMYTEGSPVIETPLSAAQSLQDMLIQSWGDKIRIFPALPSTWHDVTIENMRTQGAFLVTAVRHDDHTQFIELTSLAGAPCRIWTDISDPTSTIPLKSVGDDVYDVPLAKGQSIVIHSAGEKPDLIVAPVPADLANCNAWGLHSRIK